MEEEANEISQIQQAVSGNEQQSQAFQEEPPSPEQMQNFQGMQPSIMEEGSPQEQSAQAGSYNQVYNPGYAEGDAYANYGMSSDTMTEIAEQVVAERFTKIKDILEEVIDFKATTEAKTSSLQERLKRIEDTIDRLQLSILQKVGEYVTNTEDIKKELVETQKSFKSLLDKTPKHTQPQQQQHPHTQTKPHYQKKHK